LITALEDLIVSKEWKLILYISNIEKHHSCFDFGLYDEKYCLISTSKDAPGTVVNRGEIKSFLEENQMYISEEDVNTVVNMLKEIKYLPVPQGITNIKEIVINKVDNIGNAAVEFIERKHE